MGMKKTLGYYNFCNDIMYELLLLVLFELSNYSFTSFRAMILHHRKKINKALMIMNVYTKDVFGKCSKSL